MANILFTGCVSPPETETLPTQEARVPQTTLEEAREPAELPTPSSIAKKTPPSTPLTPTADFGQQPGLAAQQNTSMNGSYTNESYGSKDGHNKKQPGGPPLRIKNLPVVLAPYDPTTGKAGDIRFTNIRLEFERLVIDYGFVIPASSAGQAKANPQPTFIAPLETKVRSIVDGIVVGMPKTWANDYSIMVAADENSQYRYETEHVINPLVKVGDRVTAGQVIAEVGDFDSRSTPGFGLVEMGLLRGGNPPTHLCPFLYLDESAKEGILESLSRLHGDWNSYEGKTIYRESDYESPGCLTNDEIEG